jgi:hypothetical protein
MTKRRRRRFGPTKPPSAAAEKRARKARAANALADLSRKSVKELVDDFMRLEKEVIEAVRQPVRKAVQAGEILLVLKDKVKAEKGHGHWLEWVRNNLLDISVRTVQTYMGLARDRVLVEQYLTDNRRASLEDVIRLFRTPKLDDDEKAEDQADQYRGRPVAYPEVGDGDVPAEVAPDQDAVREDAKKARRELVKLFRDALKGFHNSDLPLLVEWWYSDIRPFFVRTAQEIRPLGSRLRSARGLPPEQGRAMLFQQFGPKGAELSEWQLAKVVAELQESRRRQAGEQPADGKRRIAVSMGEWSLGNALLWRRHVGEDNDDDHETTI